MCQNISKTECNVAVLVLIFFSYVNKNASFQKSLQEFFFKRSKKFYLVYQILAAVMDYYADWNLPPWLWLKQMYVTVKLLFSIV